ncbi:MAG: enoyl-CoA hydratase-related protein [Pseudomonadota bacterium]|nr:enoyl-CoA hydratase-related protein [Pseudomonadota bacterium]
MDAGPSGAEKVRWDRREGVAVLTVANPPVNALVQPVRAALLDAVERAEADPEVGVILIQAEGRTFPAGADVREFSSAAGSPTLAELCLRIEACTKPVVAAIHGTALGGGLELALACHYRMALQDARFGFPEVSLGLVPNAGGSQRLPRLVGARVALDLLTTGKPIDATRAAAAGLVDKVIQKNLDKAAFGSARNFAESGVPPRPTRLRDEGLGRARDYLDAIRARRVEVAARSDTAASRVIELVEAALLVPFEAGLDMEHAAYDDLVNSDAARGLRHAFLAERRAGRFPSLAGVSAQRVGSIGVIGAGAYARDVAMAALRAGVPVTVALEDDVAITRVRTRIERAFGEAVEAGTLSGKDRDERLRRLNVAEDYGALDAADVVIEALAEDSVRKTHALTQLAEAAAAHTIFASATAECDIETLAGASGRADRFAAMHFVDPADTNRLVEIAPARATSPATLMTLIRLARAMGKGPVLTGARQGLVYNRMIQAYYGAAALVVEQGALPAEADQAMRHYGLALGPFQAQDMSGIEAIWGLSLDACPSELPARMIEQAWYGRRTGQGYYDYRSEDGVGRVSPEVTNLIRALREYRGITPRLFEREDIQRRCLYAMANEGARLVAARVVDRPSDIDAAMLLGLGFPREKGGPMLAADLAGTVEVRKCLTQWAAEDPFWTPVPLWDELIKYGRRFETIGRA